MMSDTWIVNGVPFPSLRHARDYADLCAAQGEEIVVELSRTVSHDNPLDNLMGPVAFAPTLDPRSF